MGEYIIYLVLNSDFRYELVILNKTGVAVFLSNERGRNYKKFTKDYCELLINRVGCNSSDWNFYSLKSTSEEKREIIQDLLTLNAVEKVKSKLQHLEGHEIIYCYYA